MSDENDDAKTHPGVDVEKYTWHKDDVEWHPPNPESPLIMSLEQRQEIWNALHPGEPLPPRLRDDTYYRSEATLIKQGLLPPKSTSDARRKTRPQVRIHIHRGR